MANLASRLKEALERARITPAEIARRLDVTPQAVSGWLRTGRISKPMLAKFARETGSDLEDLIGGNEALRAEQSLARYRAGLRRVPIVGFAIATPDRDGYFDDMGFAPGAGDAYLDWPTKDPNAYALRVRGDSMQPRIRPGELIVVEPSAPINLGDDVVVRTRDGRKMVKQLLLRRPGEVTLGSINQAHQQATISLENIESMHFITAIVPRGAGVKEE